MDRRRAIASLAALAAVLATGLEAQERQRLRRVGLLISRSRSTIQRAGYDATFVNALHELGYSEGKNIAIEWRFADGDYERLPALAGELLRINPDVIVAWAPPSTRAAKQATSSIPIVMIGVGDPVGNGFVASLSRPGANVTGISNMTLELSAKYLEVLQAVVPTVARVAVLVNPANPSHNKVLENVQASGKGRVKIIPVDARTRSEIDAAFTGARKARAEALIVTADGFFVSQAAQIVQLAARHRLPSIYTTREFAEAGGLMSYGQNLAEHFRLAAVYVDKILKGAKPAELPVEQPTKFELVVNIDTAKQLGIRLSRDFLATVDEVIQ